MAVNWGQISHLFYLCAHDYYRSMKFIPATTITVSIETICHTGDLLPFLDEVKKLAKEVTCQERINLPTTVRICQPESDWRLIDLVIKKFTMRTSSSFLVTGTFEDDNSIFKFKLAQSR